VSKKLYIGNLPYSCDDQQLSDLVAPYGEVQSASVIKDKFSGQSKGFGFVEIGDDSAALKAIEELDGKEMGGRNLKVNEARPMVPREGGGGGGGFNCRGGGGGGGRGPRREGGGGGGGRGGYGGGGGGGGDRDRGNRGNRW
jgi:cold-inducible RNA-binding protein